MKYPTIVLFALAALVLPTLATNDYLWGTIGDNDYKLAKDTVSKAFFVGVVQKKTYVFKQSVSDIHIYFYHIPLIHSIHNIHNRTTWTPWPLRPLRLRTKRNRTEPPWFYPVEVLDPRELPLNLPPRGAAVSVIWWKYGAVEMHFTNVSMCTNNKIRCSITQGVFFLSFLLRQYSTLDPYRNLVLIIFFILWLGVFIPKSCCSRQTVNNIFPKF